MFGYVRAYKPEMKIKDYEAYRGIYCSVCRALGKGYGAFARFTLSYDITMLAVIRIAVSGGKVCFKSGRCPFNAAKRCNYCCNKNDELDYAAAVGVLLVYYKLKDNLHDDGFFGKLAALLMLPYISLAARKAKKRYPEISQQLACLIDEQNAVEQKESTSVDEAAEPMAKALAAAFSYNTEGSSKRLLERLGYCLGRWVYIADAAQDIEKDIKKGSYNVFVNAGGISDGDAQKIIQAREHARLTLNFSCAEAIKAYELCEISSLKAVIDNVLYDGLYSSMNDALSGEKKKRKKTKEIITLD